MKVSRTNEEWKQMVKELTEPVELQNLTFVEPLESRAVTDILYGLSLIYSKVKALGIPLFRLHTDREKAMTTRRFSQWCAERSLVQTMTAGDEGPANGRIEGEVGQMKRRLRLILKHSKMGITTWPLGATQQAAQGFGNHYKSATGFWSEGGGENETMAQEWRHLKSLQNDAVVGAVTIHVNRMGGS